jgi:shikimate dehydrogenase
VLSQQPGRLVLLGHPVAHSLSPAFQNAALRSAGVSIEYEALDVPPAQLATIAGLLTEVNGAGNVTVPHKLAFAGLCARLSPVAERVGAVNTFWTEGGALVGDNTDVGGFDVAVRSAFGGLWDGVEVAVIGAGGGASAVLAAVERWENARARVFSRSRQHSDALVGRFARTATAVGDLAEALDGVALAVNATPVGLRGDELPVEPSLLAADTAVFDLSYRRGGTPWIHACRARGLRAVDGLAMLIEQGALSFERWFGMAPDRRVMWEAVL